MKTIEERMNNPIVAEDLLGALVVFNSDPALIEFIEDADFTVESLAKCHLTYYLPDDEKFEEACKELDLDPIVNAVKCVWFFMITLISAVIFASVKIGYMDKLNVTNKSFPPLQYAGLGNF